MRRWNEISRVLKRCGLAIVLSALVSGALAWGFAAWEQRKGGAYTDPEGANVWSRTNVDGIKDPITPFVKIMTGAPIARHDRTKFGTSLMMLASGWMQPTEMREWSFGWPLRCLQFSEKGAAPYSAGVFRPVRTSAWINGLEVVPLSGQRLVLPIRVRGWELAGDVGIWSGIFGSLLFGVPLVRANLRKRRGHCATCDYDRSTIPASSPCPECGRAPS